MATNRSRIEQEFFLTTTIRQFDDSGVFILSRILEFENFFFLFVSALALFQACSFIGICHLDVTNSPSKIS